MKKRIPVAAVFSGFLATLGVTACSDDGSEDPVSFTAAGKDRLPGETLSDWVSYADLVAVVKVTDEREIPVIESVSGEYRDIRRQLTLEVQDSLWERPGVKKPVTSIPFEASGWKQPENGDKFPLGIAGQPWFQVGSSYVIALADFPREGWGQICGSCAVPLDGTKVAKDPKIPGGAQGVTASAQGLDITQLAEQLKSAKPDPRAEKFATLPPDARYDAVQQEP